MAEDATRKDRRDQRKQDDDLTPLIPAVVFPALIDVPPASASTPTPAADPVPSWTAVSVAATPGAPAAEATSEKQRPVAADSQGRQTCARERVSTYAGRPRARGEAVS